MKRLIVLVAIAGLMLASMGVPAEAKKKKKKPQKIERVVEFEYVCPCVGLYQFGSATGGTNLGGGPFQPQVGEVYLTATAADATGMPVPVEVDQDIDGDGFNDLVGSFCGETTSPIAINEGLEIRIFVGGPTYCPSPAALAGGSITFTLSNLP